MDRRVLDYLMRKTSSGYDLSDERDYEDGRDYRRGVRGSGRRDRRDRRDYDNRRDRRDNRSRRDYHNDDYEDGMRDYEDGHYNEEGELYLSKSDIKKWKQMLVNTDGTKGEHFDMQQVIHAAEKIGVKFDEYDEKEFCIVMNMHYSDYGNVVRKYLSPEKEVIFFAEMAKAFFDDPDGPEPETKLALYFHCIVCNEEV